MVEKKMWHEEDDTLYQGLKADKADYIDYDIENFKFGDEPNNGKLPTSRLDQGRNCPRCAGRLQLKEITKKNLNVHLYCKHCGIQVFAEDIDYVDPVSDALYTTIPDDVFLQWDEYRINRRKK